MSNWQATLREQLILRRDPWLVLEGQAMVEAALAGWWDVTGVLVAGDHPWEVPVWSGMEVVRVPADEMVGWSGEAEQSGVLGLARLPSETGEVATFLRGLDTEALVVVCPRVDDPALAGEAIRLAAEHGAAGVLFGAEGVSPFHAEALRVAAGAVFQLPVRVADGGLLLRSLKAAGVELCGWEPAGISGETMSTGRRALVMGDPESGLGPFWRAACDRQIGGDATAVIRVLAARSDA